MNVLNQLKESFESIWLQIASAAPKIFGAIIGIVIALIIIKVLVKLLKKGLTLVKANKLDDKLNQIELFGDKKINIKIIDVLTKVFKWLLYLLLLLVITDLLELNMVSDGLKNILAYLPKLFTAIIIFVVGLLFANFVKKSLQSFFESMDLSGSKIISQIVFTLILIFISITALNQADIDTEIITSNLTLIITGFLFAFALAFGLGSQKVMGDLLRTFYARKTYEVGQLIKLNGTQGKIETINGISITIKTEAGKIIVPIKDIVESQVEVQE